MKNVLKATKIGGGVLSSFGLFWLTSHPKSKVKRGLPEIWLRNLMLAPNIRLKHKDVIYHLHHWVIFSFTYALLFLLRRRLLRFGLVHGVIIGAIIQGLTYADRFRVRY